jgi:hypothetical protein
MPGKATSKKVASLASELLSNARTPPKGKSVAASDLGQREKPKPKPKPKAR